MGHENEHHLIVNAWFQRVQGRSVEALLQAFEDTFAAVWQRSSLTLGEVMLKAIVERVIHTSTEEYPVLASLAVGPSGLRCKELRSREGLRHDQIFAATQFVLAEFLTVLGNLTAQILTPALHAELSKDHVNAGDSGTSTETAS